MAKKNVVESLVVGSFRKGLTARGKRIHSCKWERCVAKVKGRSPRVNPYAVCSASLGRKKSFVKPTTKVCKR